MISTVRRRFGLALILAFLSIQAGAELWINWHGPFQIDGFSLGVGDREVYNRLGSPTRVRLVGPERDQQWIYPQHSFVFHGWEACGVTGPEVSQNGRTLAQKDQPNLQFISQLGSVEPGYEGYRFFPYTQPAFGGKFGLPGIREEMLRVRYLTGKPVAFELDERPSHQGFDHPDEASSCPPLPHEGGVTVNLQTSVGPVSIELYPQADPESVNRVLSLVKTGFYNDTPICRVLPGCEVLFGVNSRPAYKNEGNYKPKYWEKNRFRLEAGTVLFSSATYLSINLQDLPDGRYALPIGRVTQGLEALGRLSDLNLVHDMAWYSYWENSSNRQGPYIHSAR